MYKITSLPVKFNNSQSSEANSSKISLTPQLICTWRKRGVILFPRERLFPVKSIVTGHDIDSLHDSFGKSVYGKEFVLTARKSGAGICKMGGHCGGFGMGQLAA